VVTGGGGQIIESFLSMTTPYTKELWIDFNSVEVTLNSERLVLRGVAPDGTPEGLEIDRVTIDKSPRPEFAFIRGYASFDGRIDIANAIRVLEYLFLGREAHCEMALDWDNDGTPQINDPILCLEYLFISGRPAPAPFPNCGTDPTGADDDAFCHQTGCF
jgi:hypothetical protein